MRLHVFLAFISQLRAVGGRSDSRHVTLREQAAIFLYTCVTGLSLRHAVERFQPSVDTISKHSLPYAFNSPLADCVAIDISARFGSPFPPRPFIHSMSDFPPFTIRFHPRFGTIPNGFRLFKGAVGSMRGTHNQLLSGCR
jgi:hypothetical protein